MKKLFVVGLALLLVTTAFGQMTVLWEKTAVNGTMPSWFDNAHLTRGLAYGVVGGQERLYVATRNGGNLVYILDPATGDTIGRLNTTGMSGGTYVLNDVEVSADGIIFVCNLKIVSATDTVFKVYKWTSEAAAPEVAVSYVNKDMRLGDKITVTGSASDNSLVIWAASATAGQNKVVKFTTTDNGATFTPTIVNIDAAGGSASVGPLPDGSFYWNANGNNPKKYAADGTLIGGIPGSVVATGSTAIRYIATVNGCEFFVTHQFGTGNENARIVKVPMGDPTQAVTYAITPSQQLNANTNGTGDVAVKDNGDGTFTVYVLSTNNGYGAYVIDLMPPVKVTFLANTAGVPDTLQAHHTVQIRGFWPFTWNNESQGIMTNIGGDYWSYTIELPRDSLTRPIEYKFCTFPVEPSALTAEMNGWEAGGNRVLDLTSYAGSDTTLPLQFVRGWSGSAGQFETPFEVTDSIDVFLRVNMEALVKAQAFNPETEFVGVRGSNAWGDWSGTPDFNWGSTHRFVKENNHANGIWGSTYNGTYFWNGVLHLPKDWAGKEIQYKFLIGDAWGRDESANRSLILPADGSDVTVHWVWFNNVPPAGFTGQDTADITFYADMTKAIANNGFEIGDTLLVKYGYFGSSVEVKTATMVRQSGTQNYFVTVADVPLSFGKPLYYQYYMVKSGQEQREVYFNFDYTGSVPSEAERRAFVVESPTPVIADIVDSDVDARRMPVFRNNKPLARPVAVTVECDVRPAIYQLKAGSTLNDIQSGIHITPEMLTADPDTVFKLGVYINGPMSNNGEGTWITWGGTLASDPNRKMWDDGTHGDAVAHDSIYTIVYNFDPALGHRVGQEFKFGIGGGDNESGYGLNHIENINDANATFVMHNQWGSINPKFYNAWNFDLRRPATAVREEGIPVVTKYALEQNFPNPFNPTTQIRFAIPEAGEVHLTIYNALGQVVNRVVFSNLSMGVYSYFWDGKDLRGNNVASGIYFYELRAGNKFRDLKKMVLMK